MLERRTIRDEIRLNAKLILIGEAPGREELRKGLPFVGASGHRLTAWWHQVDLKRSDFSIINVLNFCPPNIVAVTTADMDAGIAKVRRLIAQHHNAMVIIPTGNTALNAVMGYTGIDAIRGSILSCWFSGEPIKVIPTLHPAQLLRGQEKKTFSCLHDWHRIKYEMNFRARRLPERTHLTFPNRTDINDFVRRAQGAPYLAIDIENDKKTKELICCSFALSRHEGIVIPWEAKWQKDAIRTLCASAPQKVLQGGLFDAYRLAAEDCPIQNYVWDTLYMHHALCPRSRHSLAYLASIFTREPHWKDIAKEAGGYTVSANREKFYRYASLDAVVDYEIFERLHKRLRASGQLPFYLRHYAELLPILTAVGMHGISLDETARQGKHQELSEQIEQTKTYLEQTTGTQLFGPKALSTKKTAAFLYDALRLPKRYGRPSAKKQIKALKTDEVTLRRLILRWPDTCLLHCMDEWKTRAKDKTLTVQQRSQARHFRLVKKHLPFCKGNLQKIGQEILNVKRYLQLRIFVNEARVDQDFRIRCQYSPNTEEGRLSSKETPLGTGTNLQNQDRELRSMFLADRRCISCGAYREDAPGSMKCKDCGDRMRKTVLVELDLSQAEGRVVYTLSGDKELLALARSKPWEFDMHSANAAELMSRLEGRTILPAEVTKEQRYLGKKTEHASQRGMRGDKLAGEALKEGYTWTSEEAQAAIDAYMEAKPGIAVYMAKIRREVMRNKALTNTWGRVWYCRYDAFGEDLWRVAYSVKPQSEVADITNQWGLKPAFNYLTKTGHGRVNLQCHDAIIASVYPEHVYDYCTYMMTSLERPRIYWGESLTIPVGVKIGRTWAGDAEYKRLPSRADMDEVCQLITKV